ncbi:MAG TPA: Uma2 family endonuclease [Candidatus Xenobia bacterium]|jgi:Uma2 family endonuclease
MLERDVKPPDRFEIVRGEILALSPTNAVHGQVETRITRLLGNEAEDAGLGLAFGGEVGVVVVHEPLRTVRGADAAFILQSQLPYDISSEGYLLTAPALVVEVLSPNDRASEVQEKVLEYLSAGVQVVWVVDPLSRSVAVYRKNGAGLLLREDDVLVAPGVLDNLKTKVSWLFHGLPHPSQPPADKV